MVLIRLDVVTEPFRNPAKNPLSLYSAPYGVCWEPLSGFLVYVDNARGSLHLLKMMNIPSENETLAKNLGQPTGVCILNKVN